MTNSLVTIRGWVLTSWQSRSPFNLPKLAMFSGPFHGHRTLAGSMTGWRVELWQWVVINIGLTFGVVHKIISSWCNLLMAGSIWPGPIVGWLAHSGLTLQLLMLTNMDSMADKFTLDAVHADFSVQFSWNVAKNRLTGGNTRGWRW